MGRERALAPGCEQVLQPIEILSERVGCGSKEPDNRRRHHTACAGINIGIGGVCHEGRRYEDPYRQSDQHCEVELLENGQCRVVFDQPQRAVAPGQSVVFYLDEVCLGGGIITQALKTLADSDLAIAD